MSPRFVWLIPSWYESSWWRLNYGNSTCTPEIMRSILNNTLTYIAEGYFVSDDAEKSTPTISGLVWFLLMKYHIYPQELFYIDLFMCLCYRQWMNLMLSIWGGYKNHVTKKWTWGLPVLQDCCMMLCGQWHWHCKKCQTGWKWMTAVGVTISLVNWFLSRNLTTKMS